MSASLVGSEMCIRDRRSTARHSRCASGRKRWMGGWWGGVLLAPTGQQPVSYTHLTLPTICSV
eukprot:2846236-Alexandrium_andersonii.AAC.1